MTTLPPEFLTRQLAHRGLHDGGKTRMENGLGAMRAAIDAGFGIECDLQISSDGQAMVFHDPTLDRLTSETGPISARTAAELGKIRLGETDDTIPRLADLLALTAGRAPLLIELKNQTRTGIGIGPLEAVTAQALMGYPGPVALISFQPLMVGELARIAPEIPRGLVGKDFDEPHLSTEENAALTDYAAFDTTASCFVTHKWQDLGAPAVARLKARGVPVLCWTVRSTDDEATARKIADNITFEGYVPA
jgi:glycerophosphoryl diester phosphodiesterase